MNVLELFAGAGGGILKNGLLGHRTVCAVEIDPFRRAVLCARQDDGTFPPFPVWDDVRTFDGGAWRGRVDVVSGGFPCQDISCAGPRTGIQGPRSSLWFEMLRIVREIRPRFVFVENSDALVRNGLAVVLQGLAESGYDAEWFVLGAYDVGAPHLRNRCWLLASDSYRKHGTLGGDEKCPIKRDVQAKTETFADSFGVGCPLSSPGGFPAVPLPGGIDCPGWWSDEPGVARVVHGVADWTHRVKATGDGQVPLCAAWAWKILYSRICGGSR